MTFRSLAEALQEIFRDDLEKAEQPISFRKGWRSYLIVALIVIMFWLPYMVFAFWVCGGW